MHILESVPDDEVPEGASRASRTGIWVDLIQRMLAARQQGRVLVVKLPDNKELYRLRNGVQIGLRKAGYLLHPAIIQEDDGLKVYLQLEPRNPPKNGAVERDQIGRRRPKAR